MAGDETIVLTSDVDKRSGDPNRSPIWQKVVTSTYDANDTDDITLTEDFDGLMQKVVFKVPAFTNGITGQLVIKDSESNTVFDSGEKTKGATYTFSVIEPLIGACSIVMGVSGAAGGSGGSMVATLRGV